MWNQTAYRLLCLDNGNESIVFVYIQLVSGAFGNILAAILLLISQNEHKWQSIYIFFAGLVMTDLIHNCVCYSIALHRYTSHFTWCLPTYMCEFYSFTEVFLNLASGMIIALMTIDRYLYIMRSQNHSRNHSRRRTYVCALVGVLILAGLAAGLHLMGLGDSQLFYPGSWCFFDFTANTIDNKINAMIFSLICVCTLLVTVIIGVRTIVMIRRNPEYQALLLDHHLVTGIYDKHVTTFLVFSIVSLPLLWAPFLVDIIMHTINLPGPFDGKELHLWLIRLMYLNTEINPWLYVILRRESVRKFFVMISQCWRRFCTKENNDAHENIIDFAVYK
uniref:Prostaglandin E2 receptor EP4 subtype-like n=1 Tax=Crassostrea virginica TaxID=6565 RepID=A0A8B8CQX4_CRAVI|nr:prostaglandin E2 receptor EP4 subtype-like [Crassostrea virginica]